MRGPTPRAHLRLVTPVADARYVRCVPIELKAEDEGSVAVVAELVEVIGPEPPAEGQADS